MPQNAQRAFEDGQDGLVLGPTGPAFAGDDALERQDRNQEVADRDGDRLAELFATALEAVHVHHDVKQICAAASEKRGRGTRGGNAGGGQASDAACHDAAITTAPAAASWCIITTRYQPNSRSHAISGIRSSAGIASMAAFCLAKPSVR